MEKEACKKVFEKDAKAGALKICGIGECIAEYETCDHQNRCGHQNSKSGFKFPSLGTGTDICPLAKYNVKPEENPLPWNKRPFRDSNPTEDEFFALCACCDFSEVTEKEGEYELTRTDFEGKCIKCPVLMTEEAIQEVKAEARCS